MNSKTQYRIRLISSIVKVLCGYMLVDLFAETTTWLFLISGLLLLIAGLNYLVPTIMDRIQLYIINKKDPDCNIIKDVKKGVDEQ